MRRRPTKDNDEAGKAPKPGQISDLFGILKREGQPTRTIEEINEAIARGWAGIDRDEDE